MSKQPNKKLETNNISDYHLNQVNLNRKWWLSLWKLIAFAHNIPVLSGSSPTHCAGPIIGLFIPWPPRDITIGFVLSTQPSSISCPRTCATCCLQLAVCAIPTLSHGSCINSLGLIQSLEEPRAHPGPGSTFRTLFPRWIQSPYKT